jgi:hypothetical protein
MNDEDQAGNLGAEEYSRYREKWVHEDHLINHRLNWLIMTQTILFAAYGLLIGVKVGKSEPKLEDCKCLENLEMDKIENILNVLPAIGIAVSTLILLGIIGAVGVMYELRKSRTEQVENMDIGVALLTSILGQLTGLLLPIVFIIGWLLLLF